MAQFTAEQREYIGSTINIAIGKIEEKVGSILGQGEAMQKNLQEIVEKHNAELHASTDRVTGLVDKANTAHEELEGSTARIDDSDAKIKKAEQIVSDLMEKLKVFETNQMAVFESHKEQITKLNSGTETSVQGLDAKLDSAVAGTRADVQAEFNDMNTKLHTFCAGVKAEVQAGVAHVAGGGKGLDFESKGGGKGNGIDRKRWQFGSCLRT